MRFIRSILAVTALVAALPLAAQNITTSFVATTVSNGSTGITGRLCATPVDQYGNAIAITKYGGGYYRQGAAFCASLTSGVLSSLSLPDSRTDSAPGHGYSVVIYDSVNSVASNPFTIYGITGTTWSLDTYTPAASVPVSTAYTYTSGTGSHPTSCIAPAQDARINSGVVSFGNCFAGVFVDVASGASGSATAAVVGVTSVSSVVAPPKIIFSDDQCGDSDSLYVLSALHHWIDSGQVQVVAMVADSLCGLSAPSMKAFETAYGHTTIPIYAYQGGTTLGAQAWQTAIVTAYGSTSDTRSNYTDCVTGLRTQLAAAAAASIVLVETGFANCIEPLRESAADGISTLTGAQLIQQKISQIVIMGGVAAGGTEYNFSGSPAYWNTWFTNVTVPNGYPPIYMIDYTDGSIGNAGVNANTPATNIEAIGAAAAGVYYRPMWDSMALLYGVFGNIGSAWTVSASGTNTVNSSTGANTFSTGTASGQYYLTNNQPASFYQAYLNGSPTVNATAYAGAAAYVPKPDPGTFTTNFVQCNTLQCQYSGVWTVGPSGLLDAVVQVLGRGGSGVLTGNQLSLTTAGGTNSADSVIANTGKTSTATLTGGNMSQTGATAGLTITNTTDTTYSAPFKFLNSALTAGHSVEVDVGRDASNNDYAGLGFQYVGLNSANNYFHVGFYGGSDIFRGYANGHTYTQGISTQLVGSSIASATTIAPVNGVQHVTGTTAIATITAPSPMSSIIGGCVTLVPDGAWTTSTSGNIAVASTAVVSKPLVECYDGTKWYPSY